MICLDNSEWMRNGDYAPTRMEAQAETVNHIINRKINNNQESTVGMLSMAGDRIEMHMSPGRSIGQLMNCVRGVHINGKCNFAVGLKTAQLALKNRQNKNQRQRIVMFVGSPVTADLKELKKLGSGFKKNKVALDVINFGAENATNENTEKLETLVNAANSSDNCHLLNVPPGPHILSDLVCTSAILTEGGGAAPAAGGAVGGGMSMEEEDPELAMVLRMSMEEERQRQERAQASAGVDGDTAAAVAAAAMQDDDEYEDDDALLAQAIAMSMAADGGDVDMSDVAATPAPKPKPAEAPAAPEKAKPEAAEAAAKPDAAAAMLEDAAAEEDINDVLNDADFLNDLLESVPGMEGDVDDILSSLADGGGDDKNDEKK